MITQCRIATNGFLREQNIQRRWETIKSREGDHSLVMTGTHWKIVPLGNKYGWVPTRK